jgi:hypothetical protein
VSGLFTSFQLAKSFSDNRPIRNLHPGFDLFPPNARKNGNHLWSGVFSCMLIPASPPPDDDFQKYAPRRQPPRRESQNALIARNGPLKYLGGYFVLPVLFYGADHENFIRETGQLFVRHAGNSGY